ncbi:MAG: hypothetical protein WKG07_33785 [Hymenobacter sp.]
MEANITPPADGRAVYDALFSKAADGFKSGQRLPRSIVSAPARCARGAHAARPIGGVQVATPVVFRDYTAERDPLHITVSAAVVDTGNKILVGAAPLQDPRHRSFRHGAGQAISIVPPTKTPAS